jgi:hypothetical protein
LQLLYPSCSIKEQEQRLGGLESVWCESGMKCLPVDCCFNELALKKSNWACWSRWKCTSSSSHQQTKCLIYDISEKLFHWHLTTIVHSFTLLPVYRLHVFLHEHLYVLNGFRVCYFIVIDKMLFKFLWILLNVVCI